MSFGHSNLFNKKYSPGAGFWGYVGPPLRCDWGTENWDELDGARRYVPVADTMEAEDEALEELCLEI